MASPSVSRSCIAGLTADGSGPARFLAARGFMAMQRWYSGAQNRWNAKIYFRLVMHDRSLGLWPFKVVHKCFLPYMPTFKGWIMAQKIISRQPLETICSVADNHVSRIMREPCGHISLTKA